MNVGKLAEAAGFVAGVTVTLALRSSRKWNAPILADGQPVEQIPGASRIGGYAIRQRHQQVVGPKVSARAEQLATGTLRELVAGFGVGATDAPGATYRLEATLGERLRAFGRAGT